MIIPEKEQFSGSLIGQCLGDALGFPVEGYPPDTCRQYVDETLKTGHVGERGRGPFTFGQYTDDSQLARELMQSYVSCRKFNPHDYAYRISAIFAEGRVVGRGSATEQAAWRLLKGVSWEESGTPAPSAGNGSAMRAGPIGLFFFENPQQLIQAAYDQGRITHKDRRCSAGAVAIAGAVALALQSRKIDSHLFLSRLSKWSQTIEPSLACEIQKLIKWSSFPPEKAVTIISKAGLDLNYSDNWKGISPFVIGSVLWSLYSFLRTPEDYREAICTSISAGGDVDTTAAMTGAISGAYLGIKAIPPDLSSHLTDQGTWGFAELVELANKCYDLKMQQLKTK